MPLRMIGPDHPTLRALACSPGWQMELELIPRPLYRERLLESLNSPLPAYQAVCVPGHLWLPELAHAGRLAPLDTLLPAIGQALHDAYRADDILPAVAAESRYRGIPYLLPLFTDGQMLLYRPDLVAVEEEGGVPVVSPRDLGALAAWCCPNGVTPLALAAGPDSILWDWLPFLWAEGGCLIDLQGRPAFAGPAGVRALETYCSLRRFCPPDVHRWGPENVAAAVREGQVAMAPVWTSQLPALAGGAYRLAVYTQPLGVTWGVAVVAGLSREEREAVLAALMAGLGPAVEDGVTRPAGGAVRRSAFADLSRHPWLAPQLEMLTRSNTLPADPRLGPVVSVLEGALYRAFCGESSAHEALAGAMERVLARA
ncbi:MAG: ABC transporter substrate-binding protein [Bacillota bacterium]